MVSYVHVEVDFCELTEIAVTCNGGGWACAWRFLTSRSFAGHDEVGTCRSAQLQNKRTTVAKLRDFGNMRYSVTLPDKSLRYVRKKEVCAYASHATTKSKACVMCFIESLQRVSREERLLEYLTGLPSTAVYFPTPSSSTHVDTLSVLFQFASQSSDVCAVKVRRAEQVGGI